MRRFIFSATVLLLGFVNVAAKQNAPRAGALRGSRALQTEMDLSNIELSNDTIQVLSELYQSSLAHADSGGKPQAQTDKLGVVTVLKRACAPYATLSADPTTKRVGDSSDELNIRSFDAVKKACHDFTSQVPLPAPASPPEANGDSSHEDFEIPADRLAVLKEACRDFDGSNITTATLLSEHSDLADDIALPGPLVLRGACQILWLDDEPEPTETSESEFDELFEFCDTQQMPAFGWESHLDPREMIVAEACHMIKLEEAAENMSHTEPPALAESP